MIATNSKTFLNEVWVSLGRTVRQTLKAVVKSEVTEPTAKMGALDVYSSSGNLLRASAAFLGNLGDYIEYREATGRYDGSIAHRKLMSSTQFLADAIDTFACVSHELNPQREPQKHDESHCFPLCVEAERATTDRLSSAIHEGLRTLDGCHVVLTEAKDNHDQLRNFLDHLRGVIKDKFSLADFANN
jgi:hypothetical protein